MLIPEQYGGSGLPLSDACAVLEEIHRSGCNAGAAHAQMYTMGTVLRHGSDKQKEDLLPKIASGELRLQAFGVSEPNNGTDTMSLETTATLDANGENYTINGQKMWTSRAMHSDMMILLARTTPNSKDPKIRRKALSVFLLDMKAALGNGMEIHPVETMMNHSTTTIFFDNVKVPAENLIGVEGDGLDYILTSMNSERILIASECIGDGRYFIDKAKAYACERHVFGRPIGQNQGVQFPIAQAYAAVESASLMVERAATLYDSGEGCGKEANMAKLLAADASWKAADTCIQTHGGYGFAKEYDIERKFRETRLYQVAPISTNFILSFLAEKVLGLPRSY
jgi:alkylation response protein AidB-like acyl-CoA dehydrogenase